MTSIAPILLLQQDFLGRTQTSNLTHSRYEAKEHISSLQLINRQALTSDSHICN